MLLKELDFLSPNITLYHKGTLSHTSWMSGLLSLLSIIILIFCAIYYSLDLIRRQNPKSFFYNRFTEDAGIIPINSSSFFHYISMSNVNEPYEDMKFDFQSFRIIGIEIYFENYIKYPNLTNYDHWLYGKCNKEEDTQDIDYLINQKYFRDFACIRKYYDSKNGKYYNTDESEFRWPIMAYGLSNPNRKFYSIIIEKCQTNTLEEIFGKGKKCKTNLEMEEFFNGYYAFHFDFIDQFVDVLKYKNPNIKYWTRIENIIAKDNYSENHLNLNPTIIQTHDGIILDNNKEKKSYTFDRNDAFTYAKKETQIYSIYNLWLKNRLQCYDRTYKKIQDVISEIGGVSQAITVVAAFFNCFFNKYTTLINTEKLISPYLQKNTNEKKSQKNKIELRNIEINNDSNKTIEKCNENYESTKGQITEKQNIMNKNSNSNQEVNSLNNNAYINEDNNKFEDTQIVNSKDENYNKNENGKKRFNFWKYRLYRLTWGKKYNYFKLYEDFRIKMISEEHIINNHLSVCNLLKVNEINEFNKNYFSLQDLINKG